MEDKSDKIAGGILALAWLINLIKAFQEANNDHVSLTMIHLMGVALAPLSIITVWF